ncbi:phosphotransferase [Niallia sp. JL1B1071]|uniref:phosphotransferase n=1 Tax=Niallia tiangongensis TaxID=3237105 RepID=UPI0037DD1A01
MDKLLKMQLESLIGSISTIDRLEEQGGTSIVHQVITKSGTYLLKSSFKEKYREWLQAEAIVLEKLVSQSIIPVPHYYGFLEEQNSSHLIMSFEQGITLTTALAQAKTDTAKLPLIKSLGQLLHKLHSTEIKEPFHHSDEWLSERLQKAEYYVRNGWTEGSNELLTLLVKNKPLKVKQTIIHGDCTTDNVLVVNGTVTKFIDVAGMTVGDPRYDEALAIRSFVHDKKLKNAFYEGYKHYKITLDEFRYFDEGLYEFF